MLPLLYKVSLHARSCPHQPTNPATLSPSTSPPLQRLSKRSCRKHARQPFLFLFTPPPRRAPYLFVPIDPGRAVGRRELVCPRKLACVENLVFSLLLDLKLTVVVVYSCSFAPDRWSSPNPSQRYYFLQCDILYLSLHLGPHWVSPTPSFTTHFLTYPIFL
jgi:hypothetical protein